MAQKFLNLEEAAQQLGISKEKLNELREQNRVYAYRDGAGWKFKQEEIDRAAAELREGDGGLGEEELDLDLMGTEADSILLSEVELGESGKTSSSTIIGKNDNEPSGDDELAISDSDLQLASESGLALDAGEPIGGSDVLAGGQGKAEADPGDTKGSGVGSQFDHIEELEFDLDSDSSPNQASEATAEAQDEPAGLSSLSLDSSQLQLDDGDDLEISSGMSDLKLDEDVTADEPASSNDLSLGNSDLLLAGDDDDDLQLGSESDKAKKTAEPGVMSDVTLAPGESGIELAAEEDDELVLGEPTGSDITLGTSDSGINLAPSDSGISLDDAPMQLGGSSVESLDFSHDEILLEEEGDPEAATQLKTDEDFLLTPLEDGAGEEDSSQVIALDSESFDESADTLLGGGAVGAAPLMDDVGLGSAAPGGFGQPATSATLAPARSEPESSYSIWNVLSLVLCAMLLALTGMMLFDLIRNIWSWDEAYALNSTIMDGLVNAIPIFK